MEKVNCVLLVDDDTINNFLNQRLLKKLEISESIQVVTNGADALKYLQDNCPDQCCPELILLDINMPVMDGFEFLKAFEKLSFHNKHKVVIAMLTTSTNTNDLEKVKAYPVSGFINKPLTEVKIMNIVDKYFK